MVRADLPVVAGPMDEHGMRAYGEALGRALHAPAVVALRGDLGAGKTTLAQAIARGAGVAAEVTSPTFALVHEYEGAAAPVVHMDLYRLNGPHELGNLGWDEIVYGHGIVLVEWPERAGARLPAQRLDITLREVRDDPGLRTVEAAWTD
jgi:tRNA threonylcarbamoyladenosine biosynthesis protein TsaE